MMGQDCSDGSCGYTRPGGVAHRKLRNRDALVYGPKSRYLTPTRWLWWCRQGFLHGILNAKRWNNRSEYTVFTNAHIANFRLRSLMPICQRSGCSMRKFLALCSMAMPIVHAGTLAVESLTLQKPCLRAQCS